MYCYMLACVCVQEQRDMLRNMEVQKSDLAAQIKSTDRSFRNSRTKWAPARKSCRSVNTPVTNVHHAGL
ncbi:hypothetical protein DPMN_179580 [Dreissena polymorpha]|uniref:Uncharacterized protein n=1 Tax=Dreissena polymorpha TaxID=45954 RepID=A0A9D4EHF8_DREPO|nr:hypothetical protein DPMN_179580 [Dreissena polymorpha]